MGEGPPSMREGQGPGRIRWGGFYFHHLLAGCGPQPGQAVKQTGGMAPSGLCPQEAGAGRGALLS